MPAARTKEDERLVSKPEVLDRTGMSFPTIWKRMREGKFPRSRLVNGETFWLASDLNKWMRALPVSRLKGDPPNSKPAGGW